MEPQDINQNPISPVAQPIQKETPKSQVEESPVIINWKKPLFTMLIIGGIALGLMYLVKGS